MIDEIIEKLREFTDNHHVTLWLNAGCEGPVYEFIFEKDFYDGYVDWFRFWINIDEAENVDDTINSITAHYISKIYGPDAVTM